MVIVMNQVFMTNHVTKDTLSKDIDISISYNNKYTEEDMLESAKMLFTAMPVKKVAICNDISNMYIELTKVDFEYVIDEHILNEARECIKAYGRYSQSALQRKFEIDYELADAIIQKLKAEEQE